MIQDGSTIITFLLKTMQHKCINMVKKIKKSADSSIQGRTNSQIKTTLFKYIRQQQEFISLLLIIINWYRIAQPKSKMNGNRALEPSKS